MDPETMRGLLSSAPVGRLATVRRDGRPHVVPVCFVIMDEVVYSAVDDKPKRHRHLQRVSNVAATGTASLLIDEYDDDWSRLWWVRLDGRAPLVDDTRGRAGDPFIERKVSAVPRPATVGPRARP